MDNSKENIKESGVLQKDICKKEHKPRKLGEMRNKNREGKNPEIKQNREFEPMKRTRIWKKCVAEKEDRYRLLNFSV